MTYYKIKSQRNCQRMHRDNYPLLKFMTVVFQDLTLLYSLAIARPSAASYIVLIGVVVNRWILAQCIANKIQTQTSLQLWTTLCLLKQPIPDRQPSTYCQLALTLRLFSVDMLESVLLHSSHLIQLTGFILSFQLRVMRTPTRLNLMLLMALLAVLTISGYMCKQEQPILRQTWWLDLKKVSLIMICYRALKWK